jgi:predicted site-specific integrase-resolvase
MNPWVPIHDAADVLARSIKTLRTWVHAGHIRSACDRETGTVLVHWLDARTTAATKARRHRA